MGDPAPTKPDQHQPQHVAAQHMADVHTLLSSLRERLGSHPELDEAIRKVELTLSILAVKMGGLL